MIPESDVQRLKIKTIITTQNGTYAGWLFCETAKLQALFIWRVIVAQLPGGCILRRQKKWIVFGT